MSKKRKKKKSKIVNISINQVNIKEMSLKEAQLNNSDKTEKSVKQWLIDNKIYFETLVSVCLTFAGIIVSLATLFQSCDAANDEIMLNMPLFNIKQEYVTDPNIEGAIEGVTGTYIEYTIMNQGGELTNGEAEGVTFLYISLIDPKDYSNVIDISFEIEGQFLTSFNRYNYDPEKRTFTLYRHAGDYDMMRVIDDIEAHLLNDYAYKNSIYYVDCAKVSFCDFRGDTHVLWYELSDGTFKEYFDTKTDGYVTRLYSENFDFIYSKIKDAIDKKLASNT